MNIKNLFTDDDAVSPVIGVILMVAITVILAAVIGAFVLDLGGSQEKAPQASFEFSEDTSVPEIEITHEGGDTIDSQSISVKVDGTEPSTGWNTGSSEIGAGSSMTLDGGGTHYDASTDDEVRIVWTSSSGDSSSTLTTYEIQG